MSFEILVGLYVTDNVLYDEYRAAMKPILTEYEGFFGYDFKVSDVLISPGNNDINRVFTINFTNEKQKNNFFSDPDYLLVKEKYFSPSVGSATIISSYEKIT
jgi:uncharacterized protein (DUF1330 family)